MNPFKSWPVFAATVYTSLLTAPSWWGEWWIYGPCWLLIVSWLLVPWMWVPDGEAGRPWKIALVASWCILAVLLVATGASPAGVFSAMSAVLLAYVAMGTRKWW